MALDLNRIRETVAEDWSRIQSLIQNALGSDIDILNSVNGRILSTSGKQLRPLMSLLAARACSGGHPVEASFRVAAASELLHNATLLHDDVADSSDERRGIPTLRAMMGPSVSVLVGDFWLVRSVRLILGRGFDATTDKVVKLFSKTLCDLAEGEMLQLQKSLSGDTTEADCERIIYGKTASLFETGCLSAAISVGADDALEEAVGRYARCLGMAFQVRDDILDYQKSSLELGKPAGADAGEGLITIPLLGAFRNAPEREAEIRDAIRSIGEHPDRRGEIISFVRDNGGIAYALERVNRFIDDALEALDILPECQEKTWLGDIARYIGRRDS